MRNKSICKFSILALIGSGLAAAAPGDAYSQQETVCRCWYSNVWSANEADDAGVVAYSDRALYDRGGYSQVCATGPEPEVRQWTRSCSQYFSRDPEVPENIELEQTCSYPYGIGLEYAADYKCGSDDS